MATNSPLRWRVIPLLCLAALLVLPLLADRLAGSGRVYLETGEPFQPDSSWQVLKRAKAGNVHYQLLQRSEPEYD